MKRKLFSVLLIVAIFFLIDYLFFKLTFAFGAKPLFSVLLFFFRFLLLFIFFEIFLYKKVYDFKSGKVKIAFCTLVPLLISILITERLQTIDGYYRYAKTLSLTAAGLWQPDDSLAHKAVPGAKGNYVYYIEDSAKGRIKGGVEVLFDANGFRVVPDSLKIKSDTTDLYLGCSFTFGDFLDGRFGYPYITSKLLGHNYINAGASGYGIGQMFQLANRLIKKDRFKYVFIQLSPWLTQRAMDLSGPSYYSYRPYPYFSDEGAGFKLNFPLFSTSMYSSSNVRETEPTYYEKLKFVLKDGRRTEINDYTAFKLAKLKMSLSILPAPTTRRAELEKYFYDYVIDLCKKNNVTPVLIKLQYPDADSKEIVSYLKDKAQIIDLDIDLNKKVEETGKDYKKLFSVYHISGKDTIIYDNHPNKLANELFSNRIYNDLKK